MSTKRVLRAQNLIIYVDWCYYLLNRNLDVGAWERTVMSAYIVRRIIQALVVLILVTLIAFLIMRLLPGDPVLLYIAQDEYERTTTWEEIEALRRQFGLDKPLLVQYVNWMGGVLRGDLGKSIFFQTTVAREIGRALPITVYLGMIAWVWGHVLGAIAGIICAARRGKWLDTVLTVLANIGITAPIFCVGVMLIYTFGLYFNLLPTFGYTSPFEDFG